MRERAREGDSTGLSDHVIVDELPQRLYDSLGAINYNIEIMQPFVSGIYDATYEMLGNQYDMKENQRQGLEFVGRYSGRYRRCEHEIEHDKFLA